MMSNAAATTTNKPPTTTAVDFAQVGNVAHVNFRVRCEGLGHGEEVFLVEGGTTSSTSSTNKSVPLYTTAAQFPWYHTHSPLTLTLPPRIKATAAGVAAVAPTPGAVGGGGGVPGKTSTTPALLRKRAHFAYRYAIFRAGVFHRWEEPASDGPTTTDMSHDHPPLLHGTTTKLIIPADDENTDNDNNNEDSSMMMDHETTARDNNDQPLHEIPLHLMSHRESYVVNDILGVVTTSAAATAGTGSPPDIDHIRLPTGPLYKNAGSLHQPSSSRAASGSDLVAPRPPSAESSPGTPGATRKKAVGFAPPPPTALYMKTNDAISNKTPMTKQTVYLNSTDGLVVVSVFLPIILQRHATTGQWTADWDYEMLLSMQTHLRVTRVGVPKWRGWHGNTGSASTGAPPSPEAGVPRNERDKVEEVLRPFNCVPVWIEPILFGEMYNGFCKGVLWPVLHNVTSVYSTRPDDNQVYSTNEGGQGQQLQHGPSSSSSSSSSAQSGHHHQQQHHPNHPAAVAAQQFSEYSMDDVEQGPIHGGRGREAGLWAAYNTVNRLFAERIIQYFHEGDLVWIHGFHLLILPSYLTRRIPMAKVGLFLHTPFPSSEIFRTLWCREDLLRGILNADQVGFHLFEYSRHFLTSCRRLLGLNYGMIPDSSGGHTLAIDTNGRHVVVTSIHAGVEPPVLNQILTHSTTLEKAANIRQRFLGRTICCAIDRLESLKGIPLKLLALERFLTRCPEWVGKVVLVQVGISAFERGEDYVRTKNEVTQLVQKINDMWPETVQFQEIHESDMRLQQRMALLRAADVCVVTSIRDGLNLLPLEFTIAHQDAMTELGRKDGRKRGLCILSEFASCTRVMRGALHVNPWKISEIANAFHQALNITEEERFRRIGIASEFVTRVTTQRWALAVMLDLKGVHKNINPVQVSGAGLGLGYRILGMNTGFTSLDINVVAKAYRTSKARLILVDYGGTIVNNDNLDNLVRFQMVKERSAPTMPTKNMISALRALCADKKNTVFVVSGKERHSLTRALGGIPNLGLAAEHGMFISWPTSRTTSKRRWETLVPETDRTWRSLAITIMEVYTSRTHGSYIEETEMKVLWQYRDADTEFGSLQAKELEDHLAKYLRSFPVDILHGGIEEGGYVEVRPKGVNKGVLSMRVIRRFPEIAQKQRVDFSLVLGDDHCDEPMLSVMRQIGRRVASSRKTMRGEDPLPAMPATIQLVDVSSCDDFVSPDLEVFTVTVGKKPSAAANYLHDVDEVQELMDSLVKVSTRGQGFYSAVDLTSYSGEKLNPYPLQHQKSMESTSSDTFFIGGLTKTMSVDRMHRDEGELQAESASPFLVRTNWSENLGTMEEDDDEEALCF